MDFFYTVINWYIRYPCAALPIAMQNVNHGRDGFGEYTPPGPVYAGAAVDQSDAWLERGSTLS